MKNRVPSPAKITRPVLSEVVPRTRLFHLFDKALDKPLIWISGPAGSGKTTLVASFLDARKLPCLWYYLDEGDSDIATFFYYLGLAAKCAAPRFADDSNYIVIAVTFSDGSSPDLWRLQVQGNTTVSASTCPQL